MDEALVKKLLGKKVKNCRNRLNMTQFTLGEMADIDQRQVSLIEGGKSFPSLKTLIKFTEIFSCKISDLFDFENLQNRNDLENELKYLLKNSKDESIKILYTIAKQLK